MILTGIPISDDQSMGDSLQYINSAFQTLSTKVLTLSGATGGGTDAIFWQNGQTVNSSYSIPAGVNAGSFGPITIASGVSVTVPSGGVWTVV